jgi:GTP pyrophosphokinase
LVTLYDPFEKINQLQLHDFHDWLGALPKAERNLDWSLLEKAWDFIGRLPEPMGRDQSSTAFGVISLLARIQIDQQAMCAVLLSHAIDQQNAAHIKWVEKEFGVEMTRLLAGLYRIRQITELHEAVQENERREQAEIIREMLFAVVDDVRVVLVTLAEQLYLLRTLLGKEGPGLSRVARRVDQIFAPLANLLGIWQIKWEMEDLSFRVLEPENYRRIAKCLSEKRIDRELYINEVISLLTRKLQQAGIKSDVKGRPKHIYSIWKKMQRKNVPFDEVFDVRAVRILVETVPECYATLGIIHSLWPHIPNEFDDYIATPKGNNYRSLHTAVIGPEGKPLEVQIRTHEMDHHSELGVAAHWRYKDGTGYGEAFLNKVTRLRHYLEQQREDVPAVDILRQFSSDTLDERVYVITPKGKIIDMPKGSTPIDFAYHIHSEVGHRCRGAKVNGKIVPLSYALHSGDRVDIMVHPAAHPSRDWLNASLGFIKTSRARSKIRAWFREQDYETHKTEGKQLFEKELRRFAVEDVDLDFFVARSRYQTPEEFYAALGRGDFSQEQLSNGIQDFLRERSPEKELPNLVTRKVDTTVGGDITIRGVGNLLTQIARCCSPAPDDPIIGYITVGRGVTIHHVNCPNIQALNEEERKRLIDVSWASATEQHYSANIKISAYDRSGLLSDLTSLLSRDKVNVLALHTQTNRDEQIANMVLTVEVNHVGQLRGIMDKLSCVPNVFDVRREGALRK